MTREEAKHLSNVLKAYSEDKKIEIRTLKPGGAWSKWEPIEYIDTIPLGSQYLQLRVKSEPKYRPYISAEEFLKAQKEHGPYFQPLRNSVFRIPVSVGDKGVEYNDTGTSGESFKDMAELSKWQDGTPCGILEE